MSRSSTIGIVAFSALCFATVAIGSAPAYAHTTGAYWEVPVDGYTADVGYDPMVFTAEQYTRFDFNLWKGATTSGESADFSQVWVRILRNTNTLLATGVFRQSVGPTTLLYVFPGLGDYSLDTSFRNADGDEIAHATFPISVGTGSAQGLRFSFLTFVVSTALSLLLGAFIGLRLRKM